VVTEENGELSLRDAVGIKVRAFGSQHTKKQANCGFDAIENLIPILPNIA